MKAKNTGDQHVPKSSPIPIGSGSGMAWVSSGKIIVRNPQEGASKATITTCKEIQLLINSLPVSDSVEVSQEDHLETIPLSYTDQGFIKVQLSPDRMSAFLEIKNECLKSYELIDCPPSTNLVLQARQTKQRIFRETKDTIINLLNQNHISFGIDLQALEDIITQQLEGLLLVAQGLAPGETIDDDVELLFEHKIDSDLSNALDTIDFKEMHSIPSVNAGETLAQKIIGKEGTPGTTVTNQIYKAREAKRITLLAGPGVEIVDNGLRAIANIEGLPRVQKSHNNWTISVDPVLNLSGDVDVKTGNIRFKGNVNIMGSVETDMNVSASGNITISNIVTRCKITAGGNVTIKGNIVNSEIISGGFIVICNAIKPLLSELLKTLEDLLISANLMLEKLPTNNKILFGNILMLLIEKKFTNFGTIIDKVSKKLKEVDLKLLGTYGTLLEKALVNLTGINILNFKSSLEYQALLTDLNNFYYYIESQVTSRSEIHIKVALNSVIKSSGDVIVTGGCFNTHILAEGSVHIDGIVRGGIIQAHDDIFIQQIGSEMGTKSVVIGSKDKKIKINQAFDGVTIKIGNMSRIIDRTMKNIVVLLDEDGYLQINSF
ncbi:protein of unknown function DUF342 [Desulforamulus reducens MI-1]|uniref:Flagellar Assembly Protein A N-terminal region domain-containing protein n=1 Tax=Desulforamulus reducens (strain ATCC BAA-1160 / DSM 100696 / MI-1) TaxID=349161 RepID=A4J5N0_DESRM|nr:FapA family protein [Desulforamulus reducens]ABO50383.1 protein of unknown function DUF342 [Desulforamulus reducens MI-1]